MNIDYYLNKIIIVCFLFLSMKGIAQNNVKIYPIENNSEFGIGYIDNTELDAENENYDLVLIDKIDKDTIYICYNIPYIDSNAIKYVNKELFYISNHFFVKYDITNATYDTILLESEKFYFTSFLIDVSKNIAILSSINYFTEHIMFTAIDLSLKKIIWDCSIYEENIGLEYVRISFEKKSTNVINVNSNQFKYQILLDNKTCIKISN